MLPNLPFFRLHDILSAEFPAAAPFLAGRRKKGAMAMRINVTRSSLPPMEEYAEEIRSLWDSHWLTNNGEKLKKLEAALKQRLDVPYAALFTNGHLALEALLKALGLQGEVITTPFTFASTTHAIVRAGLTPVFCDIREDDYTMDPAKVEALITPRTCAIWMKTSKSAAMWRRGTTGFCPAMRESSAPGGRRALCPTTPIIPCGSPVRPEAGTRSAPGWRRQTFTPGSISIR